MPFDLATIQLIRWQFDHMDDPDGTLTIADAMAALASLEAENE